MPGLVAMAEADDLHVTNLNVDYTPWCEKTEVNVDAPESTRRARRMGINGDLAGVVGEDKPVLEPMSQEFEGFIPERRAGLAGSQDNRAPLPDLNVNECLMAAEGLARDESNAEEAASTREALLTPSEKKEPQPFNFSAATSANNDQRKAKKIQRGASPEWNVSPAKYSQFLFV